MDHEELVQMGFPASFAKDALAKHKGDIEAALIYLTSPEVADEIQRHKNQEFQGAGALSDSNDVEMQRAIQQSVQQTGGPIDITDEDEEMQKAIEQSVQGTTVVIDETSKNPSEFIRPDFSFPVGLRNVGNTCYLNSMVQAFFTIPAVREKILQLNWSRQAETSEDAKEKLRFELQLLFGLLQLSDRKHVDPLNLVNALFKDEHLKLKLGQQEDPSEFGLFFSELLCGLKDAGELLKPLIVGETVSSLTAQEEDGSRVSVKTTEEILQTILEVEGMATIYDSLDKFTSMETIEGYETAKGYKTVANKIGFFHKSPPILSFQLKRSLFNAKTHNDYKLHSRFFFPDQLHLNRYLDINRERTLALRKRAQGFADEIAALNGKLHEFKKYSGPAEYRIDHCFDAVLNYYRQNKSDLREVLELLQLEKNNIEYNISRLEENIADLRTQSDHLFDEFSNDPYHLHAVLVHSGSTPRGGHYYTFIKTHLPNDEVRWFKFNDNEITPVSFEDVCSSSFGSEDCHSSAYCLIYIHNRLVEARKPHDIENVNYELRQHVETLNQKLRDDARDWEAAQQKVFVVVPEIKARFEAKFPEVMKGINPGMVIDQSSHDFEVFLYALEKEKLGNYVLADRVLREIVQQPIETIRPGTEQFRVLHEALPQVPWDLSADDRTILSNIRQIYDKYILVLNTWITGIEKFIARDYSTAAVLLFSALREFTTIESHLPSHLKMLLKNLREAIILTARKWGASVRTPPVHGEAVLEFANFLTSLRYDFGRYSDLEGVATEMSNQVRNFTRSYSVDKMSEILSTIEGELITPLRVVAPEVAVDTTILERTTKAYAEFDAIRRQ